VGFWAVSGISISLFIQNSMSSIMLRALQRRRGDCLFAAAAVAQVPCVAQWWSSLPVEFNQARDVMRRSISTTISCRWGLDELIRPRVVDSSGNEDSDGKQQASSKTASSSKSLGTLMDIVFGKFRGAIFGITLIRYF